MKKLLCLLFVMVFALCNTVFGEGGAGEYDYPRIHNITGKPFVSRNRLKEMESCGGTCFEFPVYIDGEKCDKTVKAYLFNNENIDDFFSFGDVIAMLGGKFSYSPQNKPKYKNGTISWGTVEISGKNYTFGSADSISYFEKYFNKFSPCFKVGLIDDENSVSGPLLGTFGFNTACLIDGEVYITTPAVYFLCDIYSKIFNLDNNSFNLKTLDCFAEQELKDKYLPVGQQGDYSDEEDVVRSSNRLTKWFWAAYTGAQDLLDRKLKMGYSIDEKNAKHYCSLLLQGHYENIIDENKLFMDYNEEMDAYIIYNKEYNKEDDPREDPDLRLAAIRAYDGKLIYFTRSGKQRK